MSEDGILKSAIRDDNPVLVFEHKLLYGSKGREAAGGLDLTTEVPAEEYLVPIGKAVIKRPGADVTLVATHVSLYRSLAAADLLARDGIECEVSTMMLELPTKLSMRRCALARKWASPAASIIPG